jgi:hypothetical protein
VIRSENLGLYSIRKRQLKAVLKLSGSMPFSLAVPIGLYIAAALSSPPSDPAKRKFFLPSATTRNARSCNRMLAASSANFVSSNWRRGLVSIQKSDSAESPELKMQKTDYCRSWGLLAVIVMLVLQAMKRELIEPFYSSQYAIM